MKKLLITLGISGLLMTGCQTARETAPETNTIAPADSALFETETDNEENVEEAPAETK